MLTTNYGDGQHRLDTARVFVEIVNVILFCVDIYSLFSSTPFSPCHLCGVFFLLMCFGHFCCGLVLSLAAVSAVARLQMSCILKWPEQWKRKASRLRAPSKTTNLLNGRTLQPPPTICIVKKFTNCIKCEANEKIRTIGFDAQAEMRIFGRLPLWRGNGVVLT